MDQEKKTDNEAKDKKPSSASFHTNVLNTNRLNGSAHLVSEIKRHAPDLPHSNENREMPLSSKGEDILDEEEESALSQIAKGVKNAKTNLEGNANVFSEVKAFWDKIPSFIKPMIPTILGYVAVAIAFIILIVILVAAPAGLVQNVVNGVSSFGEKLGNFFTFQGFQTDNELVKKRETEYYETLLAVQQEFREKYQVEIDIDLITATLFYNRAMGDYNVNDANDDNNETEGDAQAAADFYKIAKGHIKTLARYMVIQNTFESSCGDTPQQIVDPEEEKDMAKIWSFFGGIHNQRKISNIYSYNESFLYCEYKGDRDGYRDLFEQIRTRRSELEDAGNEAELNAFLEQYYNKIEVNKGETTPGGKNPSGGSGTTGDNGQTGSKAPSGGSNKPNGNKHQAQRQSNVVAIVEKNPGGSSDKNNLNVETNRTYHWEMKSCSELGAVIDDDGRCYQKDPTQIIYTASYQRESVYYYRLMEPMQLGWGLIDGKSFIEAYYPDYIGEDTKEEDVKRIVDEIYSLYDMIRSSSGRFTGNIGYGGSIGVATGEWYTWKQYDSAWKHVSLGGDPNVTLGKYGCLITSIAMQMVASGTPISLPNFNPGTFVAAMPQAFDRNGNWLGGNTWSSFAPNFRMVDQVVLAGDTNSKADTIAKWISEGYYLVVRVKYVTGQHWVAITGVENGNVIMADPGDSSSNNMYSRYPETQGHALVIKRFKG